MPNPEIEELEELLKPINTRIDPVKYKVNITNTNAADLGPQLYQFWRWPGLNSTHGTLVLTAPIDPLKAYIMGLSEGISGALRRW